MALDWWSDLFVAQLQLAAIVFAVALAVEFLLPASRERSWRALGFNLVVAVIFLYLTTLLVPPLSRALDPLRSALGHLVPVRYPDGLAGSILQTLTFFLVFDFFFYWWHRGQHAFHWLWVQHRFHHQERWINVTTVHRYHFTEEMFRVFVIYLPMGVLFDFKPVTVTWVWTVFTLWGYWIHMNVRIDLGPLGRWISGPQFHRYHHTPEYDHHNFAAFFPLWDRVFGTYHHPEHRVFPAVTGVARAGDGNTLREAIVQPFVDWARATARVAARSVRTPIGR
jgi:sterol desaturase/sphingolipid hydroxylase (fatty acid hydroxylase superfamily)